MIKPIHKKGLIPTRIGLFNLSKSTNKVLFDPERKPHSAGLKVLLGSEWAMTGPDY
ncbi:hypothetical protein [Nafulsella turpanensis]|uniref:hypothetical protein n=1 Tax=Nafulsella turpanensis TaxID=1265690 RepID=UPI000347CBDC|nr:hypothetical protein [Nafulsella turpanensis]